MGKTCTELFRQKVNAMNKQNLLAGGAFLVLAALSAACQQPTAATPNLASSGPAAAASTAPAQNPEDAMPRIKVQEAKAVLDKGEAVLIDVRGSDAYKMAHIKGSLDHALSRLEQGDFKDLPKDKRIIAYCSCPTEHSSARAALVLQKGGFKDVAALVGGNMAWEAAGYEMVKAPLPTPDPPGPKAKAGKK
jgi:rhodanese-related sulfurtransferase